MRRAVIDVGTNTVKLLVADVENGTVVPVLHMDAMTRLGEGASATHQLLPAAISRTIEVVTRYADEARSLGAMHVLALTTSAVRSATNAGEFLTACPLPVEVISGEREAELVFLGAASDPLWKDDRLLVMDVGGGSAEWIVGQAGKIERALSLPVGAVRLLEKFGDDFAGMSVSLRREFARALAPFRAGPWRMIGTGGSAVTLAAVSGQAPDHAVLSAATVRATVTHLNALPLPERKCAPGLPPERADIIVPGGAAFLFAMEALGARELMVSVRALRFGALLAS